MAKKLPPHGVGKAPPDPSTVAQFIEPTAIDVQSTAAQAAPQSDTPAEQATAPAPVAQIMPQAPRPKRNGLVVRKDGSQWRKRTVLLSPEYDDMLKRLAGGDDFPTYLAGQILTNGIAELCGKSKPYPFSPQSED